MELLNSYELSLGLEPYDVLGFDSEDHLNQELLKLIQPRSEFIKNVKINQTKSWKLKLAILSLFILRV